MSFISKIRLNFLTLVCIGLLVALGENSRAQIKEPDKQWVYEFYVSGMASAADAAKLDSLMSRMAGIYSSKTNFEIQKTIVSCVPGGDYRGLQLVVQYAGFVPDENYSFKEEIYIPTTK